MSTYVLIEKGTIPPLAVFDHMPNPSELRDSYHLSSLGWLVYLKCELHRYPTNRRPLNSTRIALDVPIWRLIGEALADYDPELVRFFCDLTESDWKRLDGWSADECRNWTYAEWSPARNLCTLLRGIIDGEQLPSDIRARSDAVVQALWQQVEQEEN
jgi:hypothetical protein